MIKGVVRDKDAKAHIAKQLADVGPAVADGMMNLKNGKLVIKTKAEKKIKTESPEKTVLKEMKLVMCKHLAL